MFTTMHRQVNGGNSTTTGTGSFSLRSSFSSYCSPSMSVNDSRATSQESDLISFSSSSIVDPKYSNSFGGGGRVLVSPAAAASGFRSSSRGSSVVRNVPIKYPLSTYRKSKACKSIEAESCVAALNSSQLTIKISEFLKRTDHIASEWKKLGREEKKKCYTNLNRRISDYINDVETATNDKLSSKEEASLPTTIQQHLVVTPRAAKTLKKISKSPTFVVKQKSDDDADAGNNCDESEVSSTSNVVVGTKLKKAKLNEVNVDLAEEHSAAQLTSDRLELEANERIRLENEVQNLQHKNKKLQESSEKLETELLCRKTVDVNGTSVLLDDDDSLVVSVGDDNPSNTAVVLYKQKYDRAMRELEYAKRRIQQQHQDDLEQMIALRKQLEKKITDAYEEVEEQRQVVVQWKRKVQKLNGEMSDLRLMLEDSNSRNNILEKKQRKFDSELSMLQDEIRQEKLNRDRLNREKEMVASDKYNLEQTISALKMDLELKDQKINNLNRELQDISYGGSTEEEVAKLKKCKHELENKIAEQDEELDDLAGQVQMLEQAKLRIEMNLEQVRKDHKKELNQREEENEEIRCNSVKKLKDMECQLENEHEQRTMLLRERHNLERKLANIEDRERNNRSADQDLVNRLKRDLKKTKVLLHDSQLMLQQAKSDAPNRTMLRQLRHQLEDAECARNTAIKAKQMAETDIAELSTTLEEVQKAKSDAEEKALLYARERTQLQSQLDENEEELAEVLKKYRNTVQQLSTEQLTLHEQNNRIAELESERTSLKDQLADITSKLENIETHGDPTSSLTVKRLELKTKELESKLELEQTTHSRMEIQISRLKEATERLQHESDVARGKEASAQEQVRKLQRTLREAREAQADSESKESIEAARKRDLEKRLEQTESELASAKADLKLALQRIDDLQCAIQGDLEDNEIDDLDDSDSDNDDIDTGSSNDSLQSYMTQTSRRISTEKWK